MRARALLVGINCYPGLGSLDGPENDVSAMEQWLQSAAGGELAPSDITKLTTTVCNSNGRPDNYVRARPIMSQIYEWVDQLIFDGGPQQVDFPLGDRLYLFFAGHGYHTTGNTAIFMANAWANNLGEAIPVRALAEYVRSYSLFREVVLIADTCRELISFAPDVFFARKPATNPNAEQVRWFEAYPCQVGSKTRELQFNNKPGGVLTNAFLSGVNGFAARNRDVRCDYLKSYMINAVQQKLGSSPEINCSDQAMLFSIAQAIDRSTRLTVTQKAGASAGQTLLIDGLNNQEIARKDLATGPLQRDVTPGFYFLRRNGCADKPICVAWENTDVEY
ncbi:caspase family protein [Candidatus Methylospira mobilis]|uniref:caspase family protein n=1 Tax=Candidatus Methylospira mobilis TaxID=1808979 RepID=UPI0028E5E64E|nr:caspase family protein [Candidatus Methylospira mobilis]WNV04265.1 caspase family protein [Candidatus Methylospira mobilis]